MGQMGELVGSVQEKIKGSSSSLLLFFIKLVSGSLVGLTFALIGEEMIDYGTLSFVFVFVLFTGVVMKLAKKWSYVGIFVFDLICVLVALLLRMYILMAPNL